MKYFLGGDVSKGYCDFTILDENKKVVMENFQLDDTFEGHCQLHEVIEKYFKKYSQLEMYAAVESTGGYENNWYSTLQSFQAEFDIKVARINPKGVNHNGKARLNRIVTDAISAYNIAEFMINQFNQIEFDADQQWKALRRHWNFVELQKRQRVQIINQMETLLYSAHPSLMQYRKDNFPNWLLELIILCPTNKELQKASPKKISKIPYLSEQRAEHLIKEAKESIASATDENTAELVRQMAKQIKSNDDNIKKQMSLIEKQLKIPEIELLKTFKGIDTTSAIGLMLEIGNIHRFRSSKSISCFFGLHPKFKQSGDKIIGVKMSKQGSKNMRKILFNIAKGAINFNPHIREIYLRKCEEGMEKMAAVGVCMHKILRIIYGMLKHNTAYNPEIDIQNKEHSKEKEQEQKQQEIVKIEKHRRYQEFDKKAPISKRQTKKRKELELSQGEITTPSAGSTSSKS